MAFYSKFGVPVDSTSGRDVTIQPKLKFKFRVRFVDFGGLESASYSFDSTQQVVSVQRPSITFSAKEIGTYAGTIKVFNKPKFNPITIRFRDDMANTFGAASGSQLQKQYDFLNGRYAASSGGAKFTTIIETLDGMDEIRAVDAFRLEGCFISNIEYGDLAYSESSANEVSVIIDYDYLGGFYSETYGVEDAQHLMWYTTAKASAYATNTPLPFTGNEEDLADKIFGGIGDAVNSGIDTIKGVASKTWFGSDE